MKGYWLVTGTSASEVERLTGFRALDTHLGTLVERPPEPPAYSLQPFTLHAGPLRRCGSIINMDTVA